MAIKKRVTEEEITHARKVDLLSYLEAKGEKFVREGNYYRHTEHDSLVIRGNKYAWNSQGEKGFGAISFAQMYYKLSFVEAVDELNQDTYSILTKRSEPKKVKGVFSYPQKNEVQDVAAIKKYLIHERKIHSNLVNWLIKKDLIAQDKKNNVVFKWRENGGTGKIIGAELQGTIKMNNKRGSYKHIMEDNKDHTGFTVDCGKPNQIERIYFFESPVELLSYWSLKQKELKNARLVSMSGLKMKTLLHSYMQAKKDGCNLKGLVLAVNHDEGGLNFCKDVEALVQKDVLAFEKDLPEKAGLDWNDVLKETVKKTELQLAKRREQEAVISL